MELFFAISVAVFVMESVGISYSNANFQKAKRKSAAIDEREKKIATMHWIFVCNGVTISRRHGNYSICATVS